MAAARHDVAQNVELGHREPLREAASAHEVVQSLQRMGSSVGTYLADVCPMGLVVVGYVKVMSLDVLLEP